MGGSDSLEEVFGVEYEVVDTVGQAQSFCYQGIAQHLHEKLTVHETHTVVDPRTVVVHIENTAFALGTVVGAFRLEDGTGEAIAFTGLCVVDGLLLTVPICGNLAGVGHDRHDDAGR